MPNVLILGGRAPVALDHARRFAHQAWGVYIADSISCRLSGWSNAVSGTVSLASPRFDPAGFVTGLQKAIAEHSIDLVLPTCEEVFFLSRYRDALPRSCRIFVDDFDKLRSLHSKWDFQPLAQECGGNPPVSTLVSNLEEARDWAAGRAIVLKPEFSRFGVHVRIYPQGMPAHAPALQDLGRWVAQEYCSGTELCSYSVADKGRLLAHAVYRPSYRLRQSSSYYFEHHDSSPILAFVRKLVEELNFTGQISFDWIDADGLHPRVLECNPRATSGVHLFSMDDALPAAFLGGAQTCVFPSSENPRMLGPIMRTAGLVQSTIGGEFSLWRKDVARASDVLTARGDRMTLLGAIADMACFGRIALRRGCTLREAATSDIEWDGEELAWI